MKQAHLIIVLLLGLTASFSASAQCVHQEGKLYYILPKVQTFPGGEEALLKFLSENFTWPSIDKDKSVEGLIEVELSLTPEGKILAPRITRPLYEVSEPMTREDYEASEAAKECSYEQYLTGKAHEAMVAKAFHDEALRVVSLLPDFSPGEISVNVKIPLRIQGNSNNTN